MLRTLLATVLFTLLTAFSAIAETGNLVIIGGGERPDYIIKEIVRLAGGDKARIVIIPNASSEPLEVGQAQQKEFEKFNPAKAEYLIFDNETADSQTNLTTLEKATGIFFSGGDQIKLMDSLKGTRLFEKIKTLYYQKGGILSGTSAGAAIMSKIMLTGAELLHNNPDFISIQQNNVGTSEGFGFVSKAIIDQHFIKRKRQNRLISLSLENPGLPCIGIDEATAIIVKSDETFSVLGESTVMIFDSAKAQQIKTDKNKNLAAGNIIMHILKSGDSFNLNTKQVIFTGE